MPFQVADTLQRLLIGQEELLQLLLQLLQLRRFCCAFCLSRGEFLGTELEFFLLSDQLCLLLVQQLLAFEQLLSAGSTFLL